DVNTLNQQPLVTILSPTNGSTFNVPADIPITVDASDADGQIVSVDFFAGEIRIGGVTQSPLTFIWSNAPVGSHSIVAKARDNRLAVTPSAPVVVTVNPPPIGSGIGLRADYYDNIDFTGAHLRRLDPVIGFDWGTGPPDPSMGADQFSVRWIGQVQPRFSETYTFYTVSDDGVRLW